MAKPKRRSVPNKAAVARHFGVSREAVTKWSRQWPFGHKGPFNLDAIAQWRADSLNPRPAPQGSDDPGELSHLARATLLLRTRQAQRLQLEIEKLRRQVISIERAKTEVASAMRKFRAAIIAGEQVLADRLEFAGLITKRHEAEQIIGEWCHSVLTELAQQLDDASSPPQD